MNFTIALVIYFLLFVGIFYYLDDHIYDHENGGEIRQFGAFYKKESLFTIFPLLITSVFISFFVSYLFF